VDLAHVVTLMEEQDSSTLRLSDNDLAELRRRRAVIKAMKIAAR
jgi:hypothetical protein